MKGESSQVCVSPDIWTARNLLSQSSPLFAEFGAFWKKNHSVVSPPFIVDPPRFPWRQNIFAHDMRVGQEAKKAHFTETAKSNLSAVYALQPFIGLRVMNMPVRSERNPDVDIRQEDHRN